MFRTAYGKREGNFITPSGRGMANTYEYVINKKGQKILEKTGETDLHAKIQEDLEECKIENILQAASTGDMTHFSAVGIYADVADVPKTLVEARQQIQKLENLWAEVPNEIKAKYNNDVEEFVGASGSEEWLMDMGIIGKMEEPMKQAENMPEAHAFGEVRKEEVTNES